VRNGGKETKHVISHIIAISALSKISALRHVPGLPLSYIHGVGFLRHIKKIENILGKMELICQRL